MLSRADTARAMRYVSNNNSGADVRRKRGLRTHDACATKRFEPPRLLRSNISLSHVPLTLPQNITEVSTEHGARTTEYNPFMWNTTITIVCTMFKCCAIAACRTE